MVATAGHTPARPSWDCQACERPWPCDPAREELVRDPHAAVLMRLHLADAVGDMPWAPPGELLERFVAWTWTPGGWISGAC
jgi:hypothetical protein